MLKISNNNVIFSHISYIHSKDESGLRWPEVQPWWPCGPLAIYSSSSYIYFKQKIKIFDFELLKKKHFLKI